jgi:hypothetical protein
MTLYISICIACYFAGIGMEKLTRRYKDKQKKRLLKQLRHQRYEAKKNKNEVKNA